MTNVVSGRGKMTTGGERCHAQISRKTLDGDERASELRIKRLVLSVPWCG